MSIQEVVVQPRTLLGKEESKRMRKRGLIPSVVYGYGVEPKNIAVEPKVINKIIHSEKGLNAVLNLRLVDTDQTRHVMIKHIDRHPVTDRLLHVDFLRIDMNRIIHATIELAFEGVPAGVKLGGILTTVHHQVDVECLPKDLPSMIRVDVTGLGMDEGIRVKDLPQYEGVTYKLDPEQTLAVVHPPQKEQVEEEEEEAVEAAVEAAPEPQDEA